MKEYTFQLSYGDYLRFRELVLEHSGLHFPDKKRSDLEIGLLKALKTTTSPISDVDSYYNYLRNGQTAAARQEMQHLINHLTVGETYFFRNNPQIEALANHILPQIITQKRQAAAAAGAGLPVAPQLRIWSAGCATGEEAYSMAMLLHELIPDRHNWNILILATDINKIALQRAQEALYSDWAFREPRARSVRSIYFNKEDKHYRLRDDIRQMVTFAHHNLIEDEIGNPMNNTVAMDLILCRNVTIYFTEDTTRHLVRKFFNSLVNEGWLIVGHSEPSMITYRDYQARVFPRAVLYQKMVAASTPKSLFGVNPVQNSTISSAQKSSSNTGNDLFSYGPVGKPDLLLTTEKAALPETNVCNQAQQLLDKGEAHKAITLLKGKMAELPRTIQPSAYCLLARAYADNGNWESARAQCQSALEVDKLEPEAYYILALVHEQQGETQEAIENLKKVIYLDAKRPLPHFNLAVLYQRTGKSAQAKKSIHNLLRILEKYTPEQEIPNSGGSSARRLMSTAQKMLTDLENGAFA